jgi:hypothetical protein
MTNEELRQELMSRIDALLGRVVLVWGRDRALLAALRGYVAGMADAELSRLQTFLTRREADEGGPPEPLP